MTACCALLGGCNWLPWRNVDLLRKEYYAAEPYTSMAYSQSIAHSSMTLAEAKKRDYAVAVRLPNVICVSLHDRRGGGADTGMTYCYDTHTDALLIEYDPNLMPDPQSDPAKLQHALGQDPTH